MFKIFMVRASILALILVAPLSTFANGPKIALWSEFTSYQELERDLPYFKSHNFTLNVAVKGGKDNLDDFFHLFQAARLAGVELRPWLLLSLSDGYWFNKWNFPAAQAFVRSFVAEAKSRKLSPDWLIFDIETPPNVIGKAEERLEAGDMAGLLHILRNAAHDHSLKGAIADYGSLLRELHSQAIKVEAVTTNFVLNDLSDKNQRIQNALGLPIVGVDWDEVSFMVYRADFERILGKMNSWFVKEYAKRAHSLFGQRAAIAVGEVGRVVFPKSFEGFQDPKDLHWDIDAAVAAGLQNIEIYSIDGMRERGYKDWLEIPEVKTKCKAGSFKAHLLMHVLDIFKILLPAAV